jgi:hypothetical protein
MPHLHIQLSNPRFTFVEQDQQLVRSTWFEGQFTESELSVDGPAGPSQVTGCIVRFVEHTSPTSLGELHCSTSWRDERGKLYPATCELKLKASAELCHFLDSFRARLMELHMLVSLDASHPVLHRLGDDVMWNPEEQNPVSASIKSIGFVPPAPHGGHDAA